MRSYFSRPGQHRPLRGISYKTVPNFKASSEYENVLKFSGENGMDK